MSYAAIGLHHPKTDWNVGGVLRAAHCYNAKFLAISGNRYRRMATDTTAAYRHTPLLSGLDDLHGAIPFDCIPIAVDLVDDAIDLPDFCHPKRAFYVFGPEDGTLGRDVLEWCPLRVKIPTTFCMNLAATVNVVLYDRLAKIRSSRVS